MAPFDHSETLTAGEILGHRGRPSIPNLNISILRRTPRPDMAREDSWDSDLGRVGLEMLVPSLVG